METVLNAIADWIKGILAGAIMSNLSGLFDSVNEQVGPVRFGERAGGRDCHAGGHEPCGF